MSIKAQTSNEQAEASKDKLPSLLQQPPNLPRLAFTMRETAEILGVSYITVHRWIKRGKLRCLGSIRNRMIPLSEIQRFLLEDLSAD